MLRPAEVFSELIDLCREIRISVQQQLIYYRASVYKAEAQPLVANKIEQLRTVSAFLHDEGILECFRDYDFLTLNKCSSSVTGECGLSFRVFKLLKDMDHALSDLQKRFTRRSNDIDSNLVLNSCQAKRRDLLAMCPQESKSWRIFQNL